MRNEEKGEVIDIGVYKYKLGLKELLASKILTEEAEKDKQRLLDIWWGLNPHQREMVIGWLSKGSVQTLPEGLTRIEVRITKDNEQRRKGVERG